LQLAMSEIDTQIRDLAARRHLPESHLARWLQFDQPARAAILQAAQALKLRTGQLVVVLDLLDEICVRGKTSATALLVEPTLHRCINGSGSAPERARNFLAQLRAIRFPRLRQTVSELEAAIAGMRLPHGIAVLLPGDLASDELTIQLKASDSRQLNLFLDTLMEKRTELERILAMLGGGDEV